VQQLPSGVFFGSSVVAGAGAGVAVAVVWFSVSLMMFSSLIAVVILGFGCFSFHPYSL
jgi:hypothetical protein